MFAASAAQPSASSFLRPFRDAPRPPAPAGIPRTLADSYEFTLNPYFPLAFGIVYFILAKTLSSLQTGKNRIAAPGWNVAVLAHNVFLAAYSAWTFLGTAPQVFGAFWRGFVEDGVAGLTHAFCDSSFSIWSSETFPKFAYLFYLSKFYVRTLVYSFVSYGLVDLAGIHRKSSTRPFSFSRERRCATVFISVQVRPR